LLPTIDIGLGIILFFVLHYSAATYKSRKELRREAKTHKTETSEC